MKSQTILRDKGFTLIEVVLTISIIAIFLGISSFVDQSFFNRKLLKEEKSVLVSILQNAQNKAMNNINGNDYGVHINKTAYVIFWEFPYDETNLSNEIIARNKNIKIYSTNLLNNDEVEVIFLQLSGDVKTTGKIDLEDKTNNKYIELLSGGLINW